MTLKWWESFSVDLCLNLEFGSIERTINKNISVEE